MTMRILLFAILMSLTSSINMNGSENNLQGGVSPNNKYAIRTSFDDELGFMYVLVSIDTEKVLVRVQSSYQSAKGEGNEWAENMNNSAQVYWRDDSGAAAIDEENHRYIGHVFLISFAQDGKALAVGIGEQKILSVTGEKWNKVRIRVHEGWGADGRLSLEVAGEAAKDKAEVESKVLLFKTYSLVLAIEPSAILKSLVETKPAGN